MTICALLSWFQEPADWLAGCVASLPKAGVTSLVAVDGAYFLYPDARRYPVSSGEQAAVILETARQHGVSATVHVPSGPWTGNEVEKRSFAFELGRATGADWFLVIDADEFVTEDAPNLPNMLEDVDGDRLGVLLVERGDAVGQSPAGRLFRNVPGLRLEGAHFRYVSDAEPDGVKDVALMNVKLEHRQREPWSERRHNQLAYYAHRNRIGAERVPETV